jgi:hypothetical protein
VDFSAIANYLPTLSADWIIFGSVSLFLTFDSLRAGPARVAALSIALPIALFLSGSISSTAFIGGFIAQASPAVQTGVFIALCIGLFIALYRMLDTGVDSLHPLQALIAGIAGAAVCLIVLLQLPGDTVPWSFGEAFSRVFGDAYRLFWLVGAYFALAMVRR